MRKPKAYWHIHHDTLMEFRAGPIKARIYWIKRCKPLSEIPIRLKLLRPVKGRLPVKLVEAWESYLITPLQDRLIALGEMHKKCLPKLEALHKKECPGCPWDGETIFPNYAHYAQRDNTTTVVIKGS